MTCQCNQARELDGETYESDFVQEFEAMLDELGQQGDPGDEADPDSEIFGSDGRVLVKDTTPAPFRYICNLQYDFPGLGCRAFATGTLIGPRTVLTVGHALYPLVNGKRTKRDERRMRVVPGRNGTLDPLPSAIAEKFHAFPGYVATGANDIGIIHLSHPIGTRVGFWTRKYTRNKGDAIGTSVIAGSLPPGQFKVNVSGYPGDMPSITTLGCQDTKGPANKCRSTFLDDKNRSLRCGTYQYSAADMTVATAGKFLYYLNDTCPGHSGSPVWVERHPSKGGRCLIAVHKGVAPGNSRNRAVFLDGSIQNWINSLYK